MLYRIANNTLDYQMFRLSVYCYHYIGINNTQTYVLSYDKMYVSYSFVISKIVLLLLLLCVTPCSLYRNRIRAN